MKSKRKIISLYIIRRGILRWVRIFSHKNFPPTRFWDIWVNKNLRGRFSKFSTYLNRKFNFISEYMHILIFSTIGGALEPKNFKFLTRSLAPPNRYFYIYSRFYIKFKIFYKTKKKFLRKNIFKGTYPILSFWDVSRFQSPPTHFFRLLIHVKNVFHGYSKYL